MAFEECAEMALVPEAELVCYLLYGHRRRDKKCFGALHECAFNKRTGRNAECLFDSVGYVARGEAKLVGIPIERVLLLTMGIHEVHETPCDIFVA